jgi:serine/threonine protein kinase
VWCCCRYFFRQIVEGLGYCCATCKQSPTSKPDLLVVVLFCCRYFFRQIVEGLGYCHRCHIAHRDLKLANFLLSTDEPMRCGSGVSVDCV